MGLMSEIDDSMTRVLLAVLRQPHPTVSTCVERTGLSRETVHIRLHRLRELGLVDFDKRGTLRPKVRHVG